MSVPGKNKRTNKDRNADRKRIKLAYDEDVENVRFVTVPDSIVPVESCPLKRIHVKNMETGLYVLE